MRAVTWRPEFNQIKKKNFDSPSSTAPHGKYQFGWLVVVYVVSTLHCRIIHVDASVFGSRTQHKHLFPSSKYCFLTRNEKNKVYKVKLSRTSKWYCSNEQQVKEIHHLPSVIVFPQLAKWHTENRSQFKFQTWLFDQIQLSVNHLRETCDILHCGEQFRRTQVWFDNWQINKNSNRRETIVRAPLFHELCAEPQTGDGNKSQLSANGTAF